MAVLTELGYDIEKMITENHKPTKRELLIKKKLYVNYMIEKYNNEIKNSTSSILTLPFSLAKIEMETMDSLIDIMLMEE